MPKHAQALYWEHLEIFETFKNMKPLISKKCLTEERSKYELCVHKTMYYATAVCLVCPWSLLWGQPFCFSSTFNCALWSEINYDLTENNCLLFVSLLLNCKEVFFSDIWSGSHLFEVIWSMELWWDQISVSGSNICEWIRIFLSHFCVYRHANLCSGLRVTIVLN